MTFPSSQINTTNLDSSADDPSLARLDLYNAVVALNQIIAGANAALGVAVLNGSGKINSTQFPNTISTAGTLELNPANSIVSIFSILRMDPIPTSVLEALSGSNLGDVAMVTDGDAGNPCLAVFDGTDWRRIALGTAISAT